MMRVRWPALGPVRRRNLRVVAYVVPFLIAGVGLQVALSAAADAQASVERVARNAAIDEAQLCLSSWDGRLGSRAAVEEAVRGTVELLIQATAGIRGTPPAPEDVAILQALITPVVRDAQANLPLPDCDREAAQQRLDALLGR